jgi:Tfp pilus assembly protein PilO
MFNLLHSCCNYISGIEVSKWLVLVEMIFAIITILFILLLDWALMCMSLLTRLYHLCYSLRPKSKFVFVFF